jgi:hypothetical protein
MLEKKNVVYFLGYILTCYRLGLIKLRVQVYTDANYMFGKFKMNSIYIYIYICIYIYIYNL